jgi:hypothetical protein
MRIMTWACCLLGILTLYVGLGGLEAVADTTYQKLNHICAPKLCPSCQPNPGGVCLFRLDVYWACVYRSGSVCLENSGDKFFVCFGDVFTGTCEAPMTPDGPCNRFMMTCGAEA